MNRATGSLSSPSTHKICVFKLHKVRHFRCYYIEIDISDCFPDYSDKLEEE
jgi:ribosomal protein L19